MSNTKSYQVVDGPSKAAISMNLFYPRKLKSQSVLQFTIQVQETGFYLDGMHHRWETNDNGDVELSVPIESVRREDRFNETWIIKGVRSRFGEVQIRFRTDSREGELKFLDAGYCKSEDTLAFVR